MNTIDVIKQALEALEETTALCENYEAVEEPDGYQFMEAKTVIPMGKAAITNLHTAIEEAERAEPVCYLREEWLGYTQSSEADLHAFPVFTHPAPIPEGWQLVPKEPTEEMGNAGVSYIPQKMCWAYARGIYKAMLAAAPKLEDV